MSIDWEKIRRLPAKERQQEYNRQATKNVVNYIDPVILVQSARKFFKENENAMDPNLDTFCECVVGWGKQRLEAYKAAYLRDKKIANRYLVCDYLFINPGVLRRVNPDDLKKLAIEVIFGDKDDVIHSLCDSLGVLADECITFRRMR